MNKIDYEELRQVWIKSTKAQAEYRLSHIEKRKKEIINIFKKDKFPDIEIAELLFNIFTFINWLAHIDLRNKKYVEDKDLIPWLQQMTLWPKHIVETFWWCLRNPNMHTATTNIFSDYDRDITIDNKKIKLFACLNLNLNFDPKRFQPSEYKPKEEDDGYFAVINPFEPNKLEVSFYYSGIRRKLLIILDSTIQNIINADIASLTKLINVNRKILPLYYAN